MNNFDTNILCMLYMDNNLKVYDYYGNKQEINSI